MYVKIRRPAKEDEKELHVFFQLVISDTFSKEGIGHMMEDIQEEIHTKKQYLDKDFESKGLNRYFLIAEVEDKIVGSIEYGPPSELILLHTNNEFQSIVEVGTVFVHPDFQRKGIGNRLLNEIYTVLAGKGMSAFCLDSGYARAQKVWKRKFGEPDYLLKDFWGKGLHHMIWRITLSTLR
ncbi:GNAT family N-acetyltransferase [Falsibacillus pallidus]|uniref:Acetyltransferase (GNAT) family protein n=1 Tax=Falsibacillus pallidus TaxID=493781 RepID=A0A370GCC9_9BACI|nr:GNAT family N-acetyltransferase [Falsibacillus pallidus]RDI41357.1 acetyltransferase (GNAT) family protein [Falsibacillus pallidus]